MQKLRGRALEEIERVSYSIMCYFNIRSGRTGLGAWHCGLVGDCGFCGYEKLERSSSGKDGKEVQPVHRSSFLTWSLSIIKERGAFAHH